MPSFIILFLLIIMLILPFALVTGAIIYENSGKLKTTEPAIINIDDPIDSIQIQPSEPVVELPGAQIDTPIATPIGIPIVEGINTWVTEHNRIRADVGQGPVIWNDDIAKGALEYSTKCKFEHSDQNTRKLNGTNSVILGENLAYGVPYSVYDDKDIMKLWEDEKPLYTHPQTVIEATGAGHYTQIINKNVTEIGCGCTNCNNSKLCVCRYNPIQIGNKSPY